ncbi:hypothetical protein JTE90_019022 [Oedothorax gibbosus]|uniref:Uncharacterized protein n=1 Tax=Oedothorax gibbosus TaxID=931172 RepID=A0AAV6TK03_9ARAC|nr:hypothetical protein JTE90_019022 [Oedothorax gibbosus]
MLQDLNPTEPAGPHSQSLSRSYGSKLADFPYLIVIVTRGCSPWRPAADYGLRTGPRKLHISLGFSRANRRARITARDAVLYENRSLSQDERFQGHELYKEKITLPRVPVDVSRVVALQHLVPKDLSPCPGWGIVTHSFPPPGRSEEQTRACVAFGRRLARNGFPIP